MIHQVESKIKKLVAISFSIGVLTVVILTNKECKCVIMILVERFLCFDAKKTEPILMKFDT